MEEEGIVRQGLGEHGWIMNPVTGEALDVMQQCVSLRIEGSESQELADTAAFESALSTFAAPFPLRMRVWRRSHSRTESGTIHRVNRDGTYDVNLDGAGGGDSAETFFGRKKGVIRDVARSELETAPLLVLGEPAGGKTTFAKQLVTWTLQNKSKNNLLPVMIRVCDLARFLSSHSSAAQCDEEEPSVWAFLKKKRTEWWPTLKEAARRKRLLIVLDGMDEAGKTHARISREIYEEYTRHPLVVTSRDMKAIESKAYDRFRRFRVMQLDRSQIRAIAQKRLRDKSRSETFLAQLHSSAALKRMAVNPLLLSVTLAVFNDLGDVEINRGIVYSMALDSMLDKALLSDKETCVRARALFRRVAWIAHTKDLGQGTRDFDDDLVHLACEQLSSTRPRWREEVQEEEEEADSVMCDSAELLRTDWKRFASMAQNGRLPLLTWYSSEDGEDKYRFAHLTFQEFLCAEQILQLWELRDINFAAHLKYLVLETTQNPAKCFMRGWWQQVLQMLSDLASTHRASINLGDAILLRQPNSSSTTKPRCGGGGGKYFWLESCIGDRNAATLAALLRDASNVDRAGVTNSGLGSVGVAVLFPSTGRPLSWLSNLRELSLLGNLIDPGAASALADSLRHANPPLASLDVSANRICVGTDRRKGYERETFHSRVKLGGTSKSKLYLDYFHAAFIPDLSGLDALVAFVSTSSTLRSFDCRSNALTANAGEMLASLLPARGERPRLRFLCGINLASLLRDDDDDDGEGDPPETFSCVTESRDHLDDELAIGDEVEAPAAPRMEHFQRYYPAVVRDRRDSMYLLQFGDDDVYQRWTPRDSIRLRAEPGTPLVPLRLEAGGCLLLARVLGLVESEKVTSSLKHLHLRHQALAFDMSVWNPPGGSQDISRGGGSIIGEQAESLGSDDEEEDTRDTSSLDPVETGINPKGLLELLQVLSQKFGRVTTLDVRDSIDLGTGLGVALAEHALSSEWKELGVGLKVLVVDELKAQERVCIREASLKDVGMAALVTLSKNARTITALAKVVSSRALQKVIDVAPSHRLENFNGINISELSNSSLEEVILSKEPMNRASVMLALSFIRSQSLPTLRVLDLSNSDLMPSCHPHPRTPELFGIGHLCNACATHHMLPLDLNLACQICDNDACGAAWRSGDIVEDLARALYAVPLLEYLLLRCTCLTTMDGPVASRPFKKLGRALSRLQHLRGIDLSGHAWSGPRLTRWCAQSLNDSNNPSANQETFDDDDDDADNLKEQRHWRSQQTFRHNHEFSDETSANDADDMRRHDERAYSRTCLPLALGWPALSRGLAKCPALEIVRVSSWADIDVGRLARGTWGDQDVVSALDFAAERLEGLEIPLPITEIRDNCDEAFANIFPEWRSAKFDLACLVFFIDLLRMSPRISSRPRRLAFDFSRIEPLCRRRAQLAIISLIDDLDEVVVKDWYLRLDLAALRSGVQTKLNVSTSAQTGGLLIAAAIDQATALVSISASTVDFGDATRDVVEAAERKKVRWFNGVDFVLPVSVYENDGVLSFEGQHIADSGALVFAKSLEDAGSVLTSLDFSSCALTPVGVSAIVDVAMSQQNLQVLNISDNIIGDAGLAKLAKLLRTNRSLLVLKLRRVRFPRSTSSAFEDFGLALEASSTLVELDLTNSAIPTKIAASLNRTFVEKQPTCAVHTGSKFALLMALRRGGFDLEESVLEFIFSLAKQRRVLHTGIARRALADMFGEISAPARAILDRMDSGELNIRHHPDIEEINRLMADLTNRDNRAISNAYNVVRQELLAGENAMQQAEEDDDDDDIFDDDDDAFSDSESGDDDFS